MLRLLGIALVAALLLATAAAGREPLTKQEYLSIVRSVADPKATDRLFDDVVNFTYVDNECSRLCSWDQATLSGEQWLRSERLLRGDIEALTTRLQAFRPPRDVALLHARWMVALNRCSESLRGLEADQRRYASGDFEMEVARRLKPACFDRFNQIIPAFEAHGYEFAPDS
jgi:hypothetical protein